MKDINFFKFHAMALVLSVGIVITMFILLGVRGFSYGTDFRGGVEATVIIDEAGLTAEGLRSQLEAAGLNTEVQQILTRENTFLIRFAVDAESELLPTLPADGGDAQQADDPTATSTAGTDATSTDEEVLIPFALDAPADTDASTNATAAKQEAAFLSPVAQLKQALGAAYASEQVAILQSRLVGSVLSAENKANAIWTSLAALLFIVGYLTLRFELPFALAAVGAVIYDVMVILMFLLLWGDEVTILVMVAILTTFGYSVNDTIVLFDRIREERKQYTSNNYVNLVNLSINRVLGRTLITSLTTLAVVMSLYFSTTGDYRIFAFYLIIGLLSGTYSSIYIAPVFLFLWDKYVRSFLVARKVT